MKLLSMIFLVISICACNESDLEKRNKLNNLARKFDSLQTTPVLIFFNSYRRINDTSKHEIGNIDLDSFETELEDVKADSILYYTYKSYCAYFKGRRGTSENYALHALKISSFNFLAESILLFNGLVNYRYDVQTATAKYKSIKIKYSKEYFCDFDKCYNELCDFVENPHLTQD